MVTVGVVLLLLAGVLTADIVLENSGQTEVMIMGQSLSFDVWGLFVLGLATGVLVVAGTQITLQGFARDRHRRRLERQRARDLAAMTRAVPTPAPRHSAPTAPTTASAPTAGSAATTGSAATAGPTPVGVAPRSGPAPVPAGGPGAVRPGGAAGTAPSRRSAVPTPAMPAQTGSVPTTAPDPVVRSQSSRQAAAAAAAAADTGPLRMGRRGTGEGQPGEGRAAGAPIEQGAAVTVPVGQAGGGRANATAPTPVAAPESAPGSGRSAGRRSARAERAATTGSPAAPARPVPTAHPGDRVVARVSDLRRKKREAQAAETVPGAPTAPGPVSGASGAVPASGSPTPPAGVRTP
ncbi:MULTISPECIES: hypothetical protein [unclassified Parafrankia]|uniref:hypothetical protein n=1 Tax=unclassified Parafrankia TaxID=2994368 RepID=UPI000DA503E1|nr:MULTISPECIES: hypothetical protein [unclassified Parafrankia]SQD99232.1 conserved hypothetical protein [Parafrankia sp. Ea1.12]